MDRSGHQHYADAAVIGGGLAGLAAAARLARDRVAVVLVDRGLPPFSRKLGGFARFSGAKFSTLPAGTGLLRLVGPQRFSTAVCHLADVLDLPLICPPSGTHLDPTPDQALSNDLRYRSYQSILLTPRQVNDLLDRLIHQMGRGTIIRGNCTQLTVSSDDTLTCMVETPGHQRVFVHARSVVFAGGRSGGRPLLELGLPENKDRALDLGVRIEVDSRSTFNGLSALGQDPKLLYRNCRTFCLNCPGRMFPYASNGIIIPGGVSAESSCAFANVGLLFRTSKKTSLLQEVSSSARKLGDAVLGRSYECRGSSLGGATDLVSDLFGPGIASELADFKRVLGDAGLADWSGAHRIHLPLMEWQWPVFGTSAGFRTSVTGLYVAGDSAGHARGLLQAALSGWLAAEEILA